MKFYYTGAIRGGEPQNDPVKSLGGYYSKSIVPNDVAGNLFSSISPDLAVKKYKEVRGIILKNTLTVDVENIFFWFETPADSDASLKIAAVTLVQDECGAYMEKVPNSTASPYDAVFYSAEGEINKVNLGSLTSGSMIGIWILRELKEDYVKLNCEDLYNLYQSETELPISEEIIIKMDWDEVTP